MKSKQYGVWVPGEDGQYWLLYDSLEDAVSDNGDRVEVYELNATYLGIYKKEVKIVKTKKAKKDNK